MIDGLDHLVLTVQSIDATCAFYEGVLGLKRVDAAGGPCALTFGTQKINLHEVARTFEPKAARPTPGAGDLCLVTSRPMDEIMAYLAACGVPIEMGPVEQHGARGPMTSVYIRDPDQNLVEVSRYRDA